MDTGTSAERHLSNCQVKLGQLPSRVRLRGKSFSLLLGRLRRFCGVNSPAVGAFHTLTKPSSPAVNMVSDCRISSRVWTRGKLIPRLCTTTVLCHLHAHLRSGPSDPWLMYALLRDLTVSNRVDARC